MCIVTCVPLKAHFTCESQELDEDSQAENQRGEQSIPRMQAWVEGRGLGTHFFCSQPL